MNDAQAYKYLEKAGENFPALLKELGQIPSLCQLCLNAIKLAVVAESAAEVETIAQLVDDWEESCGQDVYGVEQTFDTTKLAAAIRARKEA